MVVAGPHGSSQHVVNDFTATVRDLTIGAGTSYRFTAFPDVLSNAPARFDDRARPYGHGVIAGADYLDRRIIVFELTVAAATRTAAEILAHNLAEAFAPADSDEWLDVRLTGGPDGDVEYAFRGRCRGATIALGPQFRAGRFVARCRFDALDGIRYGPEETITIELADEGDGVVFPVVFPVLFGGSAGAGTGSAPNTGSIAVPWTATLTGPLTNPRIAHTESSSAVRILHGLDEEETAVVDSQRGTVLLDGTTSRPDLIAPGSRFFDLAPGANTIRLTSDSGDGSCQFTWRPGSA